MQKKRLGPILCDVCEEDVDRFGTALYLQVYVKGFEEEPDFCGWEHAEEWFAVPPDVTAWQRTDDDEGFQYWGLIVVLVVLALAAFGVFSLIRALI